MRRSHWQLVPSLGVAAVMGLAMVPKTQAAAIATWLFDEGAGSTIADSSGNGHTATVTWQGGGSWSTDSPFEPNAANNSYNFAPTEIQVPNSPALNPAGDFTVECWVKFSSLGGSPYIVSKRNVGGSQSGFILEYGGGVFGFTTINGSGYFGTNAVLGQGLFTSVPAATDTWYHIAGVHTSIENVLYVNGISNGGNGSGGAMDGNSNVLSFGHYAAGDHYAPGLQLDEVRLSDSALAASELGWNVGSLANVPEPTAMCLGTMGAFLLLRKRR